MTYDPGSGMAIQDYLENALFGAPISQAAPELSPLADSASMGGMDYSFYTDPGYAASNYQTPPYTGGDIVSDMYNQMSPPFDISQFE